MIRSTLRRNPAASSCCSMRLARFKLKDKLRDAARACRARRLRRVPDIDHGAECRALASIGGPGFGARRMRSGTGERGRNEQPHDAQQHDRESPDGPLASTRTICPFDGRWSHREHARYRLLAGVATG